DHRNGPCGILYRGLSIPDDHDLFQSLCILFQGHIDRGSSVDRDFDASVPDVADRQNGRFPYIIEGVIAIKSSLGTIGRAFDQYASPWQRTLCILNGT